MKQGCHVRTGRLGKAGRETAYIGTLGRDAEALVRLRPEEASATGTSLAARLGPLFLFPVRISCPRRQCRIGARRCDHVRVGRSGGVSWSCAPRIAAGVVVLVTLLAGGGCSGDGQTKEGVRPQATGGSAAPAVPGRWLIYGVRDGVDVLVSRTPVGDGDAQEVFRYRESGRQGAPDIAVSADGQLVAYTVDGIELHLRDVRTDSDRVLVSGVRRPAPAGTDAVAPRWSIGDMNYLTPADEAECPECGILAVGGIVFSPGAVRLAVGQHYYEGQNWGVIDIASGRYETTGDAGGDLFWRGDDEIVTVGPFYADDAEVRRATVDELPSSTVVPVGPHRSFAGSLDPKGDVVALAFDEGGESGRRRTVGTLRLVAGGLTVVDREGEKVATGFTAAGTMVWIERRGLGAVLVSEDREPAQLPEDLYSFRSVRPTGPAEVGFSGARRPACDQLSEPCSGPAPPFAQRYLLVDAGTGRVTWQSTGFGHAATLIGVFDAQP